MPDHRPANKIIEDMVAARIADHKIYLAAADQDPLPVARADLLYLWDDFNTEYLDWASLGNPVGHSHPIINRAVAEHPRYYGHTARIESKKLTRELTL